MRDIKIKERSRTPKILDPAARVPKELMKAAILESKEKAHQVSKLSGTGESQLSPSEYASEKLASGEEYAAMETGRAGKTLYKAGKGTAKKAYGKIHKTGNAHGAREPYGEDGRSTAPDGGNFPAPLEQEKAKREYAKKSLERRKQIKTREWEEEARRIGESDASPRMIEDRMGGNMEPACIPGRQKLDANGGPGLPAKAVGQDRTAPAGNRIKPERVRQSKAEQVKVKPGTSTGIKTQDNYPGRVQERIQRRVQDRLAGPRALPAPAGQTKEGRQWFTAASKGQGVIKKKMETAMAVKQMAAKYTETAAGMAKGATSSIRRIMQMAEQAINAVKAVGMMVGAIGGMAMLVLVVIVGVLGGVLFSSSSQSTAPLSQEVLNYTPLIEQYASQYGLSEYVQVIQAIMMQESAGQGTDPMQCSECPYNTRFPNSPGAITDPEYSIEVGIRYYANCVRDARCTGPQDMDRLKLSLQGYNYGNGYITWAIQNYGGYSEANALQFSQEQAAAHGWERYGDPEYVPHVLRYYSSGNIFSGLFGNGQLVSTALGQLGNEGGQKFWSWYGFGSRVSWCACFVSWCGDQCGLIASGAMPKFSLCDDGINWFKAQNRWQDRNYTPSAGTLIFFDWPDENGNRDGTSDHVGIVEKCEGGIVYTVEGNSSDAVRQSSYAIGSASIMGYGLIAC